MWRVEFRRLAPAKRLVTTSRIHGGANFGTRSIKDGVEVPRVVPKPGFLSAAQLAAATRERGALIALGDVKDYLNKQVMDWARTSPSDERIPEALFIAALANEYYKYGCGNSDSDEATRESFKTMLRQRYPQSPWIGETG